MKRLLSVLGSSAVIASLVSSLPGVAASATPLVAGDATVVFPTGTPRSGAELQNPRRIDPFGDPVLLMFILTFDKQTASADDMAVLDKDFPGPGSVETWFVSDQATREQFVFTTMPFPARLAEVVWAKRCVPPTPERPIVCRAVKVGGAPGREYFSSSRDRLRPGVQLYFVQRIVVRRERLYLLAYFGEANDKAPQPENLSTPAQKAFLRSLRFHGP